MLLHKCISSILFLGVLIINLAQGREWDKWDGECTGNAERGFSVHICDEYGQNPYYSNVVSEECKCNGKAKFGESTEKYFEVSGVDAGCFRKLGCDNIVDENVCSCARCTGKPQRYYQFDRSCNGGSGNRDGGSGGGQRRISVDNGGSSGCFNKESWCEAAKPDCSTSLARESCKKYCGLCQISSCVNKESWCEAAKPDCSTSLAKESCKKFCGLCGGGGNGGSFGGNSNGGNGGSFGGNTNRGNGGSFGGGSSSRSPSCGKKKSRGFTENGCIYECDGDILGSGTCATEKSGTCGSCFGKDWSGGSCTGEPSGCTSCSRVCRNRGK